MKRALTIFIALSYLLSVTELVQLYKLPFLFKHYSETKLVAPSLSLYQFVVMHYITTDKDDSDNEKDMQLPFKKNIANACSVNHAIFNILATTIATPTIFIKLKIIIKNDHKFYNSCSFSIWHPPQTAV